MDRTRVGIVGARGHTGSELLRLLSGHPHVEMAFASSRRAEGEPVGHGLDIRFETIDPQDLVDRDFDALFLAMPDGASVPFVEAAGTDKVIVDISADHRFSDDWEYGLPELFREKLAGARRIANPGCYATVMQLAIAPLVSRTSGTPAIFGVSGYSGAGTTPGPRNDPSRLADNLVPYKLVGHKHELEASRHLGRPVRFMPHVHPAFRGLLVTAHLPLEEEITADEVADIFRNAYQDEPLVDIQDDPPELIEGANLLGVILGGFAVGEDGRSVVVVGAEDNLLKGAAVQAIQNLNLALGLPELTGIR